MEYYRDKDFYLAVFVLMGTIIGAGMFGLPYVAVQSNFFLAVFYLVILGIFIALIHLAYAEIILRTKGQHRLLGFIEKYLGEKSKFFASLLIIFGDYGVILVYIILGGQFLFSLLGKFLGGTPFIYSLILFGGASLAIFLGLKLVAKGEFLMTLFLFLTLGIILIKGIPYVKGQQFFVFNYKNIFLPYGIALFSLSGLAAVPEMAGLLKNKKNYLKPAILVGTLIPVIIYTLFILVIVGVTGAATSRDAIGGLMDFFGDGLIITGALLGFLTVITSFLIIGLNLKESLWYDYHLPHSLAWLMTCLPPLLLFLFVSQDFIKIIGLVGSMMGGAVGVLIVIIYWQAKKKSERQPELNFNLSKLMGGVMIAIFVLGIIYEIIYSLF